jgi:hypothetical protein
VEEKSVLITVLVHGHCSKLIINHFKKLNIYAETIVPIGSLVVVKVLMN